MSTTITNSINGLEMVLGTSAPSRLNEIPVQTGRAGGEFFRRRKA